MSEVSLKAIDITNFMQIEHATQKLENLGLVLIKGENIDDTSAISNGAGKSTIADAICWALFGVTARGSSADAVINRKVGKGTKVELFFESGGNEYLLQRHRKHKTGKNRLMFHCAGKDITCGTDKETQLLVERAIGCSLEVFVASIYAGQEQMPNLPQMTDKNLKVIVEEAAGSSILHEAYQVALENRRESNKALDAETLKMSNLANSAKGLKARWEADKISKEAWSDAWVERKRAAVLAREDAQAKVDALPLPPDTEKLDRIIKAVEDKIKVMRTPVDDSEVVRTRLDAHDAKRELIKADNKLADIKKSLGNTESLIGTDCGECGRAYDEKHFDKAVTVMKRQEHTLDELVRDLNTKRDAAEQAHSDAQSAFLSAQKLVDTTELETKLLQVREMKNAANKTLSDRAVEQYRFEMAKQNSGRVDAEENPHVDHVERSAKELKSAARALATQKITLQKARDDFEVKKEVTDIFSPKGVRGHILDDVVPFLNDRTSNYLGTLSDGNITAEWLTIKDNGKGVETESFHIACDNSEGAADFNGLSGGEKRKVRIATAMALQDLVAGRADNPIKIFIADEVDDALDEAGLERLMAIFEEKARSVGTVFIISHNDIGDWVRSHITIRKEGGSSTIVEE